MEFFSYIFIQVFSNDIFTFITFLRESEISILQANWNDINCDIRFIF